VQLAIWIAVAVVSVLLLGISVSSVMRPRPTIHALPASDSMSDQEAYEVAESTIRAWVRARNDRNVANMAALMCTGPQRQIAIPYTREEPNPELGQLDAVSVGQLNRIGPNWTIPVLYRSPGEGYGGRLYTLVIQRGQLRICKASSPRM